MSQWIALQPSQHRHLGWKRFDGFHYAAADTFAPVLAVELTQLITTYPLAFLPQQEQFILISLHSLQPGLNLFVDPQSGRWNQSYIPAHYRSPAFAVKPTASGELTLCFDQDSPLIVSLEEHIGQGVLPLISEEGALEPEIESVFNFLRKCEKNRQLTQKLVNQLQEAALLEPWPLQVTLPEFETPDGRKEGGVKKIEGLYRVNEQALKRLEPEPLSQLAQSGALSIAYMQLASMARLEVLKGLYRRYAQQHHKQVAAEEIDFDALFGAQADNDSFTF